MILSSVVSFFTNSQIVFAQTEAVQVPGAAPAGPPGYFQFLLIGGMIFFMWFFIIRPQSKRQKEHKIFLDGLQAGSEVITSSGIIGKVTSITDNIVTLDLGNTQVRVLKSSVHGKLDSQGIAAAQLQKV